MERKTRRTRDAQEYPQDNPMQHQELREPEPAAAVQARLDLEAPFGRGWPKLWPDSVLDLIPWAFYYRRYGSTLPLPTSVQLGKGNFTNGNL